MIALARRNRPINCAALLLGVGLACATAAPFGDLNPSSTRDENGGKRRSQTRAELLTQADAIAATLQADPRRSNAAELRFTEAQARITAALLDEVGRVAPGDAVALAEAVKDDQHQSPAARFELARLLTMVERKETKFANREAWLESRERAAQQLTKNFPEFPAAVDELLAVADVSDRSRAVRLAETILKSSASDAIKARAQEIIWRHTATDRPISEVLAAVPGGDALLNQVRGKLAVLYTWTPEDERSVELAQALSQIDLTEVVLIGINVSPRVEEALRRAEKEKLPGEQLYNARGFDSPLVRRLGLTRSSQLYAVGKDGAVHDLTSASNRASALQKIN